MNILFYLERRVLSFFGLLLLAFERVTHQSSLLLVWLSLSILLLSGITNFLIGFVVGTVGDILWGVLGVVAGVWLMKILVDFQNSPDIEEPTHDSYRMRRYFLVPLFLVYNWMLLSEVFGYLAGVSEVRRISQYITFVGSYSFLVSILLMFATAEQSVQTEKT